MAIILLILIIIINISTLTKIRQRLIWWKKRKGEGDEG